MSASPPFFSAIIEANSEQRKSKEGFETGRGPEDADGKSKKLRNVFSDPNFQTMKKLEQLNQDSQNESTGSRHSKKDHQLEDVKVMSMD